MIPKYKVSIHAIFKQETRFLREWLEYHLLLGIEHFFLLNHDDDKTESNNLLQPYVDKGLVTNTPYNNQTGKFQINGVKQSIKEFGYLTEWLCVIDLDEFIFPLKESNIYNVLKDLEKYNCNGIYVSCCTFGSGNIKSFSGLVIENLNIKGRDNCSANYTSKHFFRPNTFIDFKISKNLKMIDEDGKDSPSGKALRSMEKIRVNHYGIRSLDYWIEKVNRSQPEPRPGIGRETKWSSELWEHKFILLDQNEIVDTSMKRFIPQLKERLK